MAVSLVSTGVTFPDNSTQTTAATGFGFKNRIINGAMVIDQRNAGASVTIPASTVTYTLDRWLGFGGQASKFSMQQNAGSLSAANRPAGFTNYLGMTSLSAYSSLAADAFIVNHYIEGFNCADLGFGTANAQSITLSFWVRSSLTGTFSISFSNSAANRVYVATYTISSANTWEQKTITIAGDTSGAWAVDNSIGLMVRFDLGSGSNFQGAAGAWGTSNITRTSGSQSVVGTNGATFYITGVQLEKGSTATSFDYRPYGTELALCQRYYWQSDALGGAVLFDIYSPTGGSQLKGIVIGRLPVDPRATPTVAVPVSASSNVSLTGFYYTCGVIQPTGSSVSTGRAYIAAGTGSITASMEL